MMDRTEVIFVYSDDEIKIAVILHIVKVLERPETLAGTEFKVFKLRCPNRSSDALFQLVKSLEKSEKRNFKLYVKRNSATEDLKIIQLFDALDKMDEYDETLLLSRNKNIKKQQLSNTKAHLYRELLTSLRLLHTEDNIDIQLHEQLDHARLLYNKGLYLQSLKMLDKIKENATSATR